ncbi:YajG family lipoprotein [Geothrix campi]|uniref:YajG family lipoprotein n=1 Tax=Geothrix campi TaxID=2966450 RepID=UPI002147CBE8|nr:YajG family lipoprotein [Geothrix sp. SG10]
MPSLLKFMGGVAAACLLAGVGCAFTTETIHIDYPAPVSIEKIKGAEAIRVKVEVKDLRPNTTREVAKKINGFGMETAPIFNDEDVQLLVKRSVETELRARGYDLEGGKVPLQIELLTFIHRYNSGFFSGDSKAEVSFVVRVKDAQGKELYTDTLVDAFQHAAGVFGGGNVKQAYEQALPGAIRKLMGKAEFHAALAKAAEGA